MSVQRIIQESVNKNPLGLKEAFAEELSKRVRLALEAKMGDDEGDEDIDESFDLSDYTVEELEDFMMSEDFEQLDEIGRKTLSSYIGKALKSKDKASGRTFTQEILRAKAKDEKTFQKRRDGIRLAADKLSGISKVRATD